MVILDNGVNNEGKAGADFPGPLNLCGYEQSRKEFMDELGSIVVDLIDCYSLAGGKPIESTDKNIPIHSCSSETM